MADSEFDADCKKLIEILTRRANRNPRAWLALIPIVVLTTSNDRSDVQRAFAAGGAGYMTKPLDYERFAKTIEAISEYWAMSMIPAQVGQ